MHETHQTYQLFSGLGNFQTLCK